MNTLERADTVPKARQAQQAGSRPRERGLTPSSVRLGSLPADSEQDLHFIQKRFAVFAKTTFIISSTFLVATSIADVTTGIYRFSVLARIAHVIGTVIALVAWRYAAQRRILSPTTLQGLDVVATLGICASFTVMGHYATQPYGFFTGMLSVTHVSITRAMVVPSVPRRTLVLGILGFGGFLVSRATMPWGAEVIAIAGQRSRGIVEALLWSAAGSSVATVASTVIYGLHAKVREARQLGQYTLEQKIGEGGMGEVYRARHAMLRRPTAVKLLSGDGTEDQLRRFEKEVQLTARLTHPNTISVFDYGRTPDGVFYYAMELLDGMTLEELVRRHGALPPSRVIHLLRQICGALREAHGVGLIHRDIKPANIYLCRRGDIPDFVKVLDFGLVRETAEEAPALSNVNAVVGTPLYLAPEAIVAPDKVDARADLYGLGGVAYYLLTGTTPFRGKSTVEVCAHHLHSVPPPPSSHRPVPADLERVVLGCLAKDPADRPESALALSRALDGCESADAWTELDAEAWWSSAAIAESGTRSVAAASSAGGAGGELRKSIVVDLERRGGISDVDASVAGPDARGPS